MGTFAEDYEVIWWALKGNESAVDFIMMLGGISQTWDDLIDKDSAVTNEMINESFENAVIDLPRNSFYRQNFLELQPSIEQAIRNWHDANRIEQEKITELYPVSYVLRDSLTDVIIRCSLIIGGKEWASDTAVIIRKQLFDETLEEYITGLNHVYKEPKAKSCI